MRTVSAGGHERPVVGRDEGDGERREVPVAHDHRLGELLEVSTLSGDVSSAEQSTSILRPVRKR